MPSFHKGWHVQRTYFSSFQIKFSIRIHFGFSKSTFEILIQKDPQLCVRRSVVDENGFGWKRVCFLWKPYRKAALVYKHNIKSQFILSTKPWFTRRQYWLAYQSRIQGEGMLGYAAPPAPTLPTTFSTLLKIQRSYAHNAAFRSN